MLNTDGSVQFHRVGELFCGAGGLALGAALASAETHDGRVLKCKHIWAVDSDPWACETFKRNLCREGECLVLALPVEELDIGGLPGVDGLLFGFPCNDFSLAGRRKGLEGPGGRLYSYGVRALELHRPLWFVAENVPGLISVNEGSAFKEMTRRMADAGYCLTAHLYRFEEYGVPQTRHRVVIVGFRKDLGLRFRVPEPSHRNKQMTAAEALREVEQVSYNNERAFHSKRVTELLQHIPPGGNAWHPEVPEHLRLNVKKYKMSNIYRRLHPDKPSPTVTGRGGGGTRLYHWAEPRALTDRERARLQTFPDDFVFVGSGKSVRSQIGGAVPPLAAKAIITAVLKTFARVEYKWIEPNIRLEEVQI